MRFRNLTTSLITLAALNFGAARAQDRFPTPIPTSDLEVFVTEVATLPDSSSNAPARMSVMTRDPSGRYFVNDQRGPLYLLDLTPGQPTQVTEYLDMRDYAALELRTASGEQGFQAFVFHPDFNQTGEAGFGKFYTILSSNDKDDTPDFDPGGSNIFHTLLVEWTCEDPIASTFSPVAGQPPYRILMRLQQPYGNHNAGLIAFQSGIDTTDPDYGNLYVAIGDGGSGADPQENGEDNSNPYGAILRINPLGTNSSNGQYGLVAANLLASDGNSSTLAEIYCYGLRNPQRFGWDTSDGRLWIADIGQNAVEEINLGANGANFGWDLREGSFPFESNSSSGLTDPVSEYDHTNTVSDLPTGISNRAVTVGEVLRDSDIPSANGLLWLGDFPTGAIFTLNVETDPLAGGQAGLSEVRPFTPSGNQVQLLDLINQTRASRGLGNASRADLRFSLDTPGRVFVLNKQDGVVRELVSPPRISVSQDQTGTVLEFSGIIQVSSDLTEGSFEDLDPQPESPWQVPLSDDPRFFRSVIR